MAALRQALCALIWVLATIPLTTLAATYSANVRWQPSSDPTVAGYRVYERTASGSYGAPQQAGMPTPAADGTMSVAASSLAVRTDYVFAVTAYTASGTESGLSNEMPTGYAQVAPLMDSDGDGLTDAAEDVNLNRIVDPGLERHWGRFGHAIADGDLRDMHAGDNPSHDIDRTWSAGHDAGAQRLEPDAAEAGMIHLRDEHRRHAVDGRAALRLDRPQCGVRIE